MKKTGTVLFAIFFISVMLSSCEYPCGKASSMLSLISFTSSESDTIIARRFFKATNFSSVKDSVLIDKFNTNFQKNGDTILVLYPGTDGNQLITSDYDYEIIIPKANVSFRISNITEPKKYGHKGGEKVYCLNTISSYKLNDQLVNANESFGFIYLKK